ncbi:MAG: TrkH family potassium uptake protein [Candidatus Nanosalina sp.]
MRLKRVAGILGHFIQIYALLTLVPAAVALMYSEPLLNVLMFLFAGGIGLAAGTAMVTEGEAREPSVQEAIVSTVLGWGFAVMIGAIPLFHFMTPLNAVFEAMAGLTTTGISMLLQPSRLPHSMLFWRGFMQWIGGLGILTFFIAVIRESGGITQRLFSAEAHKTDPGSIRPSLKKSLMDLWRVYGFFTTVLIAVFIGLGMTPFDAIVHAFSTLSTGGFSTMGASLGGFAPVIQAASIPFMFIGGVNFVLLYRLLKADLRPLARNTEFVVYSFIFLLVTGITAYTLSSNPATETPALDAMFQTASVISSTGFSTLSITEMILPVQVIFLGLMFVGGSLGSTAGGIKVFRLVALFKLLKTRVRAYTLPKSAVNKVKIDGEILDKEAVRTISVLLFTWISFVSISSLALIAFEGLSFIGATSAALSAAGNMGPVYFSGAQLVNLSVFSKSVMIIVMLAGRLEMLPLLAIFNRTIIKD